MSITAIIYDMKVWLKLILTYNIYFGCVIYEVLFFPKPCIVKAFAINVPNYEPNIVASSPDLNNEFKSKHTCRLSLFNNSKCSCNERHHYLRSCHRSVQRFTTTKPKVVGNKTLISLQHYWKKPTRHSHLNSQTNADIYRRKLLNYELLFGAHPTSSPYQRNTSFHNRIRREVILARTSDRTKKKRNIAAKDIESNDEDIDSAAWDNWSVWSACSVTCGQGRQVRWRHCLSVDCIEGLKKAQLRSCRLIDCSTKGFLGWLGVKS